MKPQVIQYGRWITGIIVLGCYLATLGLLLNGMKHGNGSVLTTCLITGLIFLTGAGVLTVEAQFKANAWWRFVAIGLIVGATIPIAWNCFQSEKQFSIEAQFPVTSQCEAKAGHHFTADLAYLRGICQHLAQIKPKAQQAFAYDLARHPINGATVKYLVTPSFMTNAETLYTPDTNKFWVAVDDSTVDLLSPQELQAIVAHELGHVVDATQLDRKLRVLETGMKIEVTLGVLWLLGLLAFKLRQRKETITKWLPVGLCLGLAWSMLGMGLAVAAVQRQAEFRADAYGARITSSLMMAQALDRLTFACDLEGTLDEPYSIFAGHPETLQRIKALGIKQSEVCKTAKLEETAWLQQFTKRIHKDDEKKE